MVDILLMKKQKRQIFNFTSRKTAKELGMLLTLKISSCILKIPNDAYTTLPTKSDWLFNTHTRVLQRDRLIL